MELSGISLTSEGAGAGLSQERVNLKWPMDKEPQHGIHPDTMDSIKSILSRLLWHDGHLDSDFFFTVDW